MKTNNVPPRWYVVNSGGMATVCASESDARELANIADNDWPEFDGTDRQSAPGQYAREAASVLQRYEGTET